MRTLDLVAGWLLIAFGALHASLTRRMHPVIDINAVWFASGGLLIIAIGALNLLRVAYGSVAKGVYVVFGPTAATATGSGTKVPIASDGGAVAAAESP